MFFSIVNSAITAYLSVHPLNKMLHKIQRFDNTKSYKTDGQSWMYVIVQSSDQHPVHNNKDNI